jgi:glycosyltransferase involved in cell wall biosynthesis
MNDAPRILLSAHQCGPGMGSVSQIGWEWYSRLAKRLRVTLVTHERNRATLTLAGVPFAGSEVHYIDTEWFAGPLYRNARRVFRKSEHSVFLVSSLDYFVYDREALERLRGLRRQGASWDLVHAVTPVSPSAVTRLHTLGLPLVLGPWNGGLVSPRNFPALMQADSAWLYPVRNFSKLLDAVASCTRSAARILVANRTTLDFLPSDVRWKCDLVQENGVDLDVFRATPWPQAPSAGNPLRVLFVGRMIPAKAVAYLLEAVRRVLPEFPLRLQLVGDGPTRLEHEQQAQALGLTHCVEFLGARPLDEIARLHAQAHVFCLPCVRESGGAVLLEAMASARPFIAVNYGGPADLVDEEVGWPLAPDGRESVIAGLVEAFRDIVRNPDSWREKGLRGRQRAERLYGWDAKIDWAVLLYKRLASQ